MKIAFIYDAVYPFMKGGGEKRYWEIGTRLAAHGHEVSLLCIQAWEGDPIRKEGNLTYIGVCPPMSLFTASGKRALKPPFAFAYGVYRHLRKVPYDLVDCCSFPLVSCMAARRALPKSVPLLITWFEVRDIEGWVRYTGISGLLAYGLQHIVARMSSFHVAISEFTKQQAYRQLGIPLERCEVIPCGVNYAEYASRSLKGDQDRLLYVGRLVKHKRVDLLIRAFQSVAGEHQDLLLTIVGTGPEETELRRMASQSGFVGRIEFTGLLPQEELVNIYRSAWTFALPSEQEGFGMVLIEAMAAGAVVLALQAERSAAAELIRDGVNGLLFRDEASLAAALRRIIADVPLSQRLAESGMQTAAEHDWERIVNRVDVYYQNLTRGR